MPRNIQEDPFDLTRLAQEALERKPSAEHDELPKMVDQFTILLKNMVRDHAPKTLLSNPLFCELAKSPNFIKYATDTQIHERILTYLASKGLKTSQKNMEKFFSMRDEQNKQACMESYAQHGLLTPDTAMKRGVTYKTSATPEDFPENTHNIRGYLFSKAPVDKKRLYGFNGFFPIVLEQPGFPMDHAAEVAKETTLNQLRNSMLFVVKNEHVENQRMYIPGILDEFIVDSDIPAEHIAYVLVAQENFPIAQKAFSRLPCKIISVGKRAENLYELYEGPYQIPDFESALNEIVKKSHSVWAHVARLPMDTYIHQK